MHPHAAVEFAGSHVCLNDVAPAGTKPDEKFVHLHA